MTVRICNRCQTRYIVESSQSDFVHDCGNAASDTLRDEDVINIGDATDFKGTGQESESGRGSPKEVFMQGLENQFFGTRAWIEGEDHEEVTARGARKSTHRTRKHFSYKDLR